MSAFCCVWFDETRLQGGSPTSFSGDVMGPFRVVVWCKACQDDEEGCFGGGTEAIGKFETREEAEKAGTEYCRGFPYAYRIERDMPVTTSNIGSMAWASELNLWFAK